MKICINLSGSIRNKYQSLSVVNRLRDAGHEVDVFIHTWKNTGYIHKGHWLSPVAEEGNEEKLVEEYKASAVMVEGWAELLNDFLKPHADHTCTKVGISLPENYNLWGMYYSIYKAWSLIHSYTYAGGKKWDLHIRLRFDGAVYDDIVEKERYNGWTIPTGNDFGGVNDRLGWYYSHDDHMITNRYLHGYYDTFSTIPILLERGCEYNPECLLKANMEYKGLDAPARVDINYSILGF